MLNEDIFFHNISARLKEFRALAAITQRELGEPAGIDRRYVAKVECGSQNPSFNFIRSICAFHNISIDWLVFGQGPTYLPGKENEKWFK